LPLITFISKYIHDEAVRDAADVQSRLGRLRIACGLLNAYFNYSTFRKLCIPQLIRISQELNNISGVILVSQYVTRRFR